MLVRRLDGWTFGGSAVSVHSKESSTDLTLQQESIPQYISDECFSKISHSSFRIVDP